VFGKDESFDPTLDNLGGCMLAVKEEDWRFTMPVSASGILSSLRFRKAVTPFYLETKKSARRWCGPRGRWQVDTLDRPRTDPGRMSKPHSEDTVFLFPEVLALGAVPS
jgi:hypothetical protein